MDSESKSIKLEHATVEGLLKELKQYKEYGITIMGSPYLEVVVDDNTKAITLEP